MKRKKTRIQFRVQVAEMLEEQMLRHEKNPNEPKGLCATQITERMIDAGMQHLLPQRNAMGGALSRIAGVRSIGEVRAGTLIIRKQKIWTIDMNRFNKWRRS